MPRRCRIGKARANSTGSIQRLSLMICLSYAYMQKSQVALHAFVTETSQTAGTRPRALRAPFVAAVCEPFVSITPRSLGESFAVIAGWIDCAEWFQPFL